MAWINFQNYKPRHLLTFLLACNYLPTLLTYLLTYLLACSFYGLGPQAYSESELTSEITNPFRRFIIYWLTDWLTD